MLRKSEPSTNINTLISPAPTDEITAEPRELTPEEQQEIAAVISTQPLDETLWIGDDNPSSAAWEKEDNAILTGYLTLLSQVAALQREATSFTPFTVATRPEISPLDYVKRLQCLLDVRATECLMAFILTIAYTTRNNILLDGFNFHRLFLTGIGVTQKFLRDDPFNNDSVAWAGGVALKDYNFLEFELLAGTQFELHASLTLQNYIFFREQLKNLLKNPALIANPNLNPIEPMRYSSRFFHKTDRITSTVILPESAAIQRSYTAPI